MGKLNTTLKKSVLFVLVVVIILLATIWFGNNNQDKDACINSNGIWRNFPDSCANNCDFVRGEVNVCSQIFTESCDCGLEKCWNGEGCENK